MTWQVVSPARTAVSDFEVFAARLATFDGFDRETDVIVARSPGRLDVMGGIADYSGSLVLQKTLAEAAWVAVQKTDERVLELVSLATDATEQRRQLTVPLDALAVTYAELKTWFADREQRWAAYFAGVLAVLATERGVRWPCGARVLIASDVPEGAGVASSAAIEVATMQAVCGVFGIEITARELALLCQTVENQVAGAACGVMDQMTAACGETDALLALLCQPAELRDPVRVPEDVELWGLDSGQRHSIAGSDYTAVRVGAFMGATMLERSHAQLRGYLANLEVDDFEKNLGRLLPERIRGAEFLARYGETTDPVTTVDPERTYAVRGPTAHPVHEHQRVRAFAELLAEPPSVERRLALGELMYASHASMSACGLGSEGTDLAVELVRRSKPESGLFGAKITGGGCGGTVAVLAGRGAGTAVEAIAADYERWSGHPARLLRGASPGADAYGTARLRWRA